MTKLKTKDRKNKIGIIIFILIITIIIINNKKYFINKQITNDTIKTTITQQYNNENKILENQIPNKVEENILTSYKGYSVIAKLEIPKIDLETYVISEYSENALGVSVTKFYGGNPNEIGNFCIAGHNYITNNMFHNLKNLSNGDKINLTDLNNYKLTYKVYSIETVNPNETKCLSQKTNGKIELTLITCTTDSTKRIIVKATNDS